MLGLFVYFLGWNFIYDSIFLIRACLKPKMANKSKIAVISKMVNKKAFSFR